MPEAVSKVDSEKGYLGVDYTQLVPVLIEAVKEQQTQISQLKSKNEQLKSRISALEEDFYNYRLLDDVFSAMEIFIY